MVLWPYIHTDIVLDLMFVFYLTLMYLIQALLIHFFGQILAVKHAEENVVWFPLTFPSCKINRKDKILSFKPY